MKKRQALKRAELKPMERSLFGRPAELLVGLWGRIQNAWFRWADLNQHAAWFPFFVAGVVAVDSVVVILPGDVLVCLALLSNPASWRKLALYTGLGSALGAFILFLTLQQFGKAPLDHLSALSGQQSVGNMSNLDAAQPDLEGGFAAVSGSQPPKWERAREFFKEYGLFSLALGSVIPFFSYAPVVLAGLSTDRWWEVLFWLLIGRQARYWLLCFGIREGWAMFRALKDEAQHKKEARDKIALKR